MSGEQSNPLVLHVRGVTGNGGGPEKTILNSARFLLPLGYNCICAYMHPPADSGFENLQQRARIAEAKLVSIPDRGAWDWRVLSQLIRYCRQQQVAVWHGHDYKSNALGLIARRFWPMKLVTTVHGWVQHTSRTPLYYAIDRRCLPRYDEVICVSDDLHQSSLDCGVAAAHCHLIQNAIDVDNFRREGQGHVSSQSADRPLILGAMGRLAAEKGFDLLIRAVAELNTEGTPCQLQIAGEGDQLVSLEQLVRELNCQPNVRLLGQVDDIKAFYGGLDLFVLSSLREGLPNVLLEAMAMEVPVVATRIAGIPRLIDSNVNGVLVEPQSISELKRGIRDLAGSRDKRDQLAIAGRRTIEDRFSFQHRMEKVAAVYDNLLRRDLPKHQKFDVGSR
jgi:glycosyltransferase involved in cell wall biosynthesis